MLLDMLILMAIFASFYLSYLAVCYCSEKIIRLRDDRLLTDRCEPEKLKFLQRIERMKREEGLLSIHFSGDPAALLAKNAKPLDCTSEELYAEMNAILDCYERGDGKPLDIK